MDLVFVYKVTKYDPADWGENGYGGDADTDSDYGPVEQAYIDTVQAFASEAGVSSLTIRDPGHHDGGRGQQDDTDDTAIRPLLQQQRLCTVDEHIGAQGEERPPDDAHRQALDTYSPHRLQIQH